MGKSYIDLLTVGSWPAAVASFGCSVEQQQRLATRITDWAQEQLAPMRQLEFFRMEEGYSTFWLAAPNGNTLRVNMYGIETGAPAAEGFSYGYDPRRCERPEHICENDSFDDEDESCTGCEYDSDWCIAHQRYH